MKHYRMGFCLALLLVLGAMPVKADHGGGGAGSLTFSQTGLERLYPPESNIYFTFQFNQLDGGVGHTLLYQLQGEYAFLQRFSIGARLPFWTATNTFLSDNTKIGDVALTFKAQAWSSAKKRMNLLVGLDTSFPTGNDQVNLGAGAVTLSPYVTYLKDFEPVDIFVSVNSGFELAGSINPTVSYELGVLVPIVEGDIPLSFFFAYQGVTYLESDTFTSGSTKGFLVPGVVLEFKENWEMGAFGRIGIIDSLNLQNNIPFNDFATGLFSDIDAGFLFNFGYKFSGKKSGDHHENHEHH